MDEGEIGAQRFDKVRLSIDFDALLVLLHARSDSGRSQHAAQTEATLRAKRCGHFFAASIAYFGKRSMPAVRKHSQALQEFRASTESYLLA
jgi:hypothetical protein